jgi:hypothetical protein
MAFIVQLRTRYKDTFEQWFERHRKWLPLSFFLLGFLYDILTLDRIDSTAGILKHAVYLTICGSILVLELFEFTGKFKPAGRTATFWHYHELIIHFFLGNLLSEYTLFFFKSASVTTSFLFVLLLAGLLVVNEFKEFKGASGIPVRMSLFSLCLIAYFTFLTPILLGFVGLFPFLLGLGFASLIVFGVFHYVLGRIKGQRELALRQIAYPFIGVLSTFAFLYFTRLIPPVPVSISYMGIFHEIKKEAGVYQLGYTRPWWQFWQHGDQVFLARTGDRIHCFVRVFSPTRFSDTVNVRWVFKDPRHGWQKQDAIPVAITGGRAEGYRGVTYKDHYQPGKWQVRVETNDGRELGRIGFEIIPDASTESREMNIELQ